MKSQKGAALIVVLSLLTISLMVGLSSMQSSQIDERLAGNYRAQTDAQMHAERVASELFERISVENHADKKELAKNFDDLSVGFGWQEISGLAAGPDYSDNCHALGGSLGVACFVGVAQGYLGLDQGNYIVAMGAVGDGDVASSELVTVRVFQKGYPGLEFPDPLSAFVCFGSHCKVRVRGSASISDDGEDYHVPGVFNCQGVGGGPDSCEAGLNSDAMELALEEGKAIQGYRFPGESGESEKNEWQGFIAEESPRTLLSIA